MREQFPTVYHGIPEPGEDTDIVNAALQDLVDQLNAVPGYLAMRVICSFVVTACCGQDDPAEVFNVISLNARNAINGFLANPDGSA